MEENNEPECEFVTFLFGFVPDVALGKKGRGPATKEFKDVELDLWNAPTAGSGALFIKHVAEPGDRRDTEEISEREFDIGRVAQQRVGRKDQQEPERSAEPKAEFAARNFFPESSIDGTGTAFTIVTDAEGDKVANPRKAIALDEVTNMEEKAGPVVLQKAVALFNIPFDDAGSLCGLGHV